MTPSMMAATPVTYPGRHAADEIQLATSGLIIQSRVTLQLEWLMPCSNFRCCHNNSIPRKICTISRFDSTKVLCVEFQEPATCQKGPLAADKDKKELYDHSFVGRGRGGADFKGYLFSPCLVSPHFMETPCKVSRIWDQLSCTAARVFLGQFPCNLVPCLFQN